MLVRNQSLRHCLDFGFRKAGWRGLKDLVVWKFEGHSNGEGGKGVLTLSYVVAIGFYLLDWKETQVKYQRMCAGTSYLLPNGCLVDD